MTWVNGRIAAQWALLTVMFLFQYFIYLSFVKLSWQK